MKGNGELTGDEREKTIELLTLAEFESKLPKSITNEIVYRMGSEGKQPLEIVQLAQKVFDSIFIAENGDN